MQRKHVINIGLRYFFVSGNENFETMIDELRGAAAQKSTTIDEFIKHANSKIRWIEKEITFSELGQWHKYLSQFSLVFVRQATIGDRVVPIGIGKFMLSDT